MVAADDTKTVVIDWGNTTRGDPVADVARSHLLMKLGWIGELSPLLGLVRRLADRLNRIYTDTYFDASGRERRQMARWLTVMAAARLEEAQPDEQAHATADLVRSGLREYTR